MATVDNIFLKSNNEHNRITLTENEIPQKWFNLIPKLPFEIPLPVNNNDTIKFNEYSWLYSKECLKIELQMEEYGSNTWINIPKVVLNEYKRYRPSPLVRALALEKYLDTPAKIYYKREDQNPGGSHKINTALPQAYYAKTDDIKTLVTDTGAGQWGVALSIACNMFDMKTIIFMIKKSFLEKPYRRYMMELLGAKVLSSPSSETDTGRQLLEEDPSNSGSLGIGMSEAIEIVKNKKIGQDILLKIKNRGK